MTTARTKNKIKSWVLSFYCW